MVSDRLTIRIAAAGAAISASLLFGVHGVLAAKPMGDTGKSASGHSSSHVCRQNENSSDGAKGKDSKRADSADRPLVHPCPRTAAAIAARTTPARPPHLQRQNSATVLPSGPAPPASLPPVSPPPPPTTAPAAVVPVNVPILTAALTNLAALTVSEPLAQVTPGGVSAAPPSAGQGEQAPSNTSRQGATTLLPPPPLVLRLPNVAAVTGSAAPAALTGVVAPAMGVAAACILAGLLASVLLVRRR